MLAYRPLSYARPCTIMPQHGQLERVPITWRSLCSAKGLLTSHCTWATEIATVVDALWGVAIVTGVVNRMERERRTIDAMIRTYCRGQHHTRHGLCLACQALSGYAQDRLDRCPFQEAKTTCAHCPVHCYVPEMRERIRAVMRYSGPRMLYRHPILALCHLVDGLRKPHVRS